MNTFGVRACILALNDEVLRADLINEKLGWEFNVMKKKLYIKKLNKEELIDDDSV